MPELKLRAAGPQDSGAIRAVLAGSFSGNPKARAEIMDWQYWDNPFGPPCSWVAEADGEVVAHYAGIRYPGVIRGERVSLGLGVDAATDPAYRGLGLFEQLARAVYLGCGQAGMPVTYCLPNPNSLRGFQKAGGQDLGGARVLVAPLDPEWLSGRFHLPRPLAAAITRAFGAGRPVPGRSTGASSRGTAGMVEQPPLGLDDLWADLAAAHGNGVARSDAWWRWRYHRRPDNPYLLVESRRHGRLVGAAAALARDDLGGTFLCILELLAADARAARDLVGFLARTAAGPLGAVGLATTALPGTPLYRRARQAGLRLLPRRFQPQPLHVGLVDNEARLPGLAGERWSLAWGDLDHI